MEKIIIREFTNLKWMEGASLSPLSVILVRKTPFLIKKRFLFKKIDLCENFLYSS